MVSLSAEALNVSLARHPVLRGIDFSVKAGALVGIIGPNGAGKSSLVRSLVGLLRPDSGRILLDGVDMAALPRRDVARRIAYLPQGQTLHWPLSVARLVALGRLPHLGPLSRIGPGDEAAIEQAMIWADILHLRERVATELSGGERARVLLARALAVAAPVLIADEPLASLDPGHQLEVMALLKARAKAGALVVAVLHDLAMAARFCDQLLLLHEGRLFASGGADVLTENALRQVYGIRAWIGAAGGAPCIVPLSPA